MGISEVLIEGDGCLGASRVKNAASAKAGGVDKSLTF
jgi:hypothetical protein